MKDEECSMGKGRHREEKGGGEWMSEWVRGREGERLKKERKKENVTAKKDDEKRMMKKENRERMEKERMGCAEKEG